MTHPEKQSSSILLAPSTCGWRVMAVTDCGDWSVEEGASFADVLKAGFALAEELRLGKRDLRLLPVNVALPVRCGVFERLTLPSTDREELSPMVRLQFEKNLPYPVEETSFGFQVLSQTDTETTLMACAAHEAALSVLCAPLLERGTPRSLDFWAMHVAAQAPANSVACGVWREEENVAFGVFENGRLGFVELLSGEADVRFVLPGVLIRAEMAGAPVDFTEVLFDPTLAEIGKALAALFGAPVRQILPQGGEPTAVDTVDLTPGKWRAEQNLRERRLRLRRRIAAAAIVYAAVLGASLAYLGIQNQRLETLRKQVFSLQPQVDAVIDLQARWKALAPAIEKRRFAVELLFQAWQCLPSADIRITRFELAPNQIVVEGEAPDAQQAILFAEKLKAHPELADYRFESAPPVLLPNEHAQFRIFGKQ